MDDQRAKLVERIAMAGTENAITIAEIMLKHKLLDQEDAAKLRGSLNNVDLVGLPSDLHRWKGEQIGRASAIVRALADPDGG